MAKIIPRHCSKCDTPIKMGILHEDENYNNVEQYGLFMECKCPGEIRWQSRYVIFRGGLSLRTLDGRQDPEADAIHIPQWEDPQWIIGFSLLKKATEYFMSHTWGCVLRASKRSYTTVGRRRV